MVREAEFPRCSATDNRENLLLHSRNLANHIFRSHLLARLLTWIETTTEDPVRLKAMKDMINEICWSVLSHYDDEIETLLCSYFETTGQPFTAKKRTIEIKQDWHWTDK